LDFSDPAAADIINGWVSLKTHGKIEEIIEPPINPLTVMFLINAIYFKGTWTYEFDKENTIDCPFYTMDGSETNCRMMFIKSDFLYYENDKVRVIDLPYGDGLFNMAVLLPAPGIDINTFIGQLTEEDWNMWMDNLTEHTVNLFLPKFELEYEITLNSVLNTLGMGIAFRPFEADFSNINDRPDLHISKVKHKTYVKVDEEGTEAAAVTVVEIGITSLPPGEVTMRVNRPFVFVIHENHSNTVLFMGKILQPVI
jgi:serpin B